MEVVKDSRQSIQLLLECPFLLVTGHEFHCLTVCSRGGGGSVGGGGLLTESPEMFLLDPAR